MGCDHHAMQWYIIGVIAGAVSQKFLVAISALLDFCYLAQMPCLDNRTLDRIEVALCTFHDNKLAIITAGARQGSNGPLEHWEIPKLKNLQHVVQSIHASGTIMQWTADITEHAHITEIKWPACAGNNQNYYSQIVRHLDCHEKCFHFDLAMHFVSIEQELGEGDEHEHEPDKDVLHVKHYHAPSPTSVNYFVLSDGSCRELAQRQTQCLV